MDTFLTIVMALVIFFGFSAEGFIRALSDLIILMVGMAFVHAMLSGFQNVSG